MAEINFIIIYACLIMINFGDSMATSGDICPKGTYYDNTECKPCPEGTFMPMEDHKRTACHECTQIVDPTLEILIKECNKTHDADIQCVDDYYRVHPRNPWQKAECKKCNACLPFMYQIRKCQNYSDTWCCSDVNYDYEYDDNGIALCRERPWMCRRGEYLDSLNQCQACPKDTFMTEDYHSHTSCWPCPYLSEADYPLHSVIIQKCNSTHPPIFRCKEGFYISHALGIITGRSIGCSPCSSCQGSYVGRKCDTFNDTICCPRPFMTVDLSDGVTCMDRATELKRNYQQNGDNDGKHIEYANNEDARKPGLQGGASNFSIGHFFGGVAAGALVCALIILAISLVRRRILVHKRLRNNNVDKEDNRDVQEVFIM